MWNDPSLVAVQDPSVASVLSTINVSITLIVRSDSSGTTEIFTSALSSFSSDWASGFGTFQSWPPSFLNANLGRVILAPGNEGVLALVKMTNYSLGMSF
jgi:phosphate transport system substrate-binding protein